MRRRAFLSILVPSLAGCSFASQERRPLSVTVSNESAQEHSLKITLSQNETLAFQESATLPPGETETYQGPQTGQYLLMFVVFNPEFMDYYEYAPDGCEKGTIEMAIQDSSVPPGIDVQVSQNACSEPGVAY